MISYRQTRPLVSRIASRYERADHAGHTLDGWHDAPPRRLSVWAILAVVLLACVAAGAIDSISHHEVHDVR